MLEHTLKIMCLCIVSNEFNSNHVHLFIGLSKEDAEQRYITKAEELKGTYGMK